MSVVVIKERLAKIAEINPPLRQTLPEDESVSFLPMAAVEADRLDAVERETRLFGNVRKGYTAFEQGDVLVAKITPCFENGKIAQAKITRPLGFGSTEFHVVRARPKLLDSRYLVHFLRQEKIRMDGQRRMTGSAGQRRVPEQFLSGLEVPLPPLPEQRRIATILDKVDAIRAKRREALAQLDRLTQSIFIEMFGDPAANPKAWKVSTLGDVADFYSGNSLPPGEEFDKQQGGFFLMRVSDMNVRGNEKEILKCQFWSAKAGARSATCPSGSIVIPKRGGAIGTNKKRIVRRPTILDPNLMAIAPKAAVVNEAYLYQWFKSFDLSAIISGSSVPQLNKKDLAPLAIHIPDVKIQDEFAEVLRSLEATRSLTVSAENQCEVLFSCLQHRAFHGEL